jgi:putative hydrolase of the HAD superfamily
MLLPGAKEALGTVRSKGYKIGLISNTGRTPGIVLRKVMENLGILEYFDTTTFSNETLVRKPAESAFRATLDKLKVAPKSAVHVGDDAEGDIAGAKRAGMRAIQIVAPGARKSNLADDYARTLDEIADKLERL